MSTRGAIARRVKGCFTAAYHHSDSYPAGLGKTLYEAFNGHFGQRMEPFLSFLIDEHPAGWSCILGADFSLPAGYITSKSHKQHPNGTPDYTQALPYGPRCYCHGGRHEDPNRLDLAAAADLPWTYEFSTGNVMRVHRGQMKRKLQCVAEVDLLDSEPDWKAIECGQQLERCVHVASYHFPELAGTPMGSLAVATLFGSRR